MNGIHLRTVFLLKYGKDILGVFSKKKLAEKFIKNQFLPQYGCQIIEEIINRPNIGI